MARSRQGTYKTTEYIDFDSPKYIARESLGQSKRGSAANDTDAAHTFGYGLLNTITTHTSGAPLSEASRRDLHYEMNSDSNLRITSTYGNRVVHERRDARIAQAFVEDKPLYGNSTAARAYQAYNSASSMNHSTARAAADAMGEMRVYNPDTGRTHKLANHHRYS
eukprot:TRINITY_DN4110_c0_g1_i2.p1 TRINITY_DN4110_c0_g1~~TRINITY_DN4110_c0_g1_i2.p1  ORF type:complete len:165 (+),score=0.82 TRINITY_DN4110_c0_g1_i2:212-706(+)